MVSGIGGPDGINFHSTGGPSLSTKEEALNLARSIQPFIESIRGFIHAPGSADNGAMLEQFANQIETLMQHVG